MSGETILVVDDSTDIQSFLDEYVLTPQGYRVLAAGDGVAGLEVALAENPDLILLDLQMPRMTGLQMLTELRKTDSRSPVIFMTMHGSESVAVEVFRLGVRDYLTKPFTIQQVTQAIDRALQETRLRREKETLARNLVTAETVRETVVTLAHYINNALMVLGNGLPVIYKSLQESGAVDDDLLKIVQSCYHSSNQIQAVLKILQRVTDVQRATYHGEVKMIDIEAALRQELARLYEEKRTRK